jgi:hypothetical protein
MGRLSVIVYPALAFARRTTPAANQGPPACLTSQASPNLDSFASKIAVPIATPLASPVAVRSSIEIRHFAFRPRVMEFQVGTTWAACNLVPGSRA